MATRKPRSKKKSLKLKFYLTFFSALFLISFGGALVFKAAINSGYLDFFGSRNIAQNQIIQQKIGSKPLRISIPKIERELQVSDGFVTDNRWIVAKSGVSYLTTSGELGQAGNVVLYGHNTKDVLGGLWKVQNGDIVEVYDSQGKVYKYQIFERKEVKPNAVEILVQTDDSRLTIYTCSGFLDTARFVVVGKLIA